MDMFTSTEIKLDEINPEERTNKPWPPIKNSVVVQLHHTILKPLVMFKLVVVVHYYISDICWQHLIKVLSIIYSLLASTTSSAW